MSTQQNTSAISPGIALPTERRKPIRNYPRSMVLFGQSKIGKTTMLSKLKGCLIIDTEKGTETIEAMSVGVNNFNELVRLYSELVKSKKSYNYIALDTIDRIVTWVETKVALENKVKDIGDIPYGGGYSQVRTTIMDMLDKFKQLTPRLIIVAHRKKIIIGEETINFTSASLDLTGKLKNFLCADSDSIVYVYRDGKSKDLMLSFHTDDELDAGTRFSELAGKIFPFDWKVIYPEAEIYE